MTLFKKFNPEELFKKATNQKKDGDINSAIETLRTAYKQLEKQGIEYPIKTYLRLPLYLQEAGRNDEAWGEFNKLISKQHDPFMKSMNHSIIYDKMRLFLEREGKKLLATRFDILSFVTLALAYKEQDRIEEFKQFQNQEDTNDYIKKILKKIKRSDLEEDLYKTISDFIQNINANKLGDFVRKVDNILNSENIK